MDVLIKVPTIPNRTRIPMGAIRHVVDQIVSGFHPQKVILFGSYAYGTPRPDSDVDLLVIMDTELSELTQSSAICRQTDYHFGLDLIVITPQNLAKRIEWGDSFLKEIIRRGAVLYESTDA
jgi:uncharacterized protein